MSPINWPDIIPFFIASGVFFVYLMHRLDGNRKETHDEIAKTRSDLEAKLEHKIDRLDAKIDKTKSDLEAQKK